jgi:hypothetical protein
MNTSDEVIKPITPNDEVSAFFEKYLPATSGTRSECFFVDDKTNKNLMINSVDDFRKIFSCSSDILPVVDFNLYTLIIGQYQMPGTAYSISEFDIVVSKKIELNIAVDCPKSTYTVICPLYYWKIYPKIQNKSISVNIKY